MFGAIHFRYRTAIACATLALTTAGALAETTVVSNNKALVVSEKSGNTQQKKPGRHRKYPQDKNIERSVFLMQLHKKAMGGNAEAQYWLGMALMSEVGTEMITNQEISTRWMVRAAKQGHADALAGLHTALKHYDLSAQLRKDALCMVDASQTPPLANK